MWTLRRCRSVASALWLLVFACGQAPAPRVPSAAIASEPPLPVARIVIDAGLPDASNVPPEPEADPAPEVVAPLPLPEAGELWVFRDGEAVGPIARAELDREKLTELDLGEAWVPPLFRSTPEHPHDYQPVFIALANARFDDSPEGRRAARERYLEPHGIPPSPSLLARRFAEFESKPCSEQLPLDTLRGFAGVAWPEDGPAPSVPDEVVAALQERLACEGHLRVPPSGVLDEDTRAALEEFERRNRIYAHGSLDGETLAALQIEPLELERRTLVRVLSERAVLQLGVIEDGSATGAQPVRASERVEDAPDVVRRIQERVLDAFGLQSVAGAKRFYQRLARLFEEPHASAGIDAVELPDYYTDDMDFWVEIDRGDLFYEFPFDAQGQPLDVSIERGPTLTLFARDGDRALPLARFPTTIGGWRVRHYGDAMYWEYKESPVGMRAWRRIDTAPVWMPPPSTPSDTLVMKLRRVADGSEFYEINQNIVGPSFASAYGLVAAYHQRIVGRNEDGVLELGRDEGIRTHGSSDYTSIWHTVSSGCHRLHNHVAMRLFNFILAHRAHRRVGHRPTFYRMAVSTPEVEGDIVVKRTGYQFLLDRPIEVDVLPGRIRGKLQHPLRRRFPAAEDPDERHQIIVTPRGTGAS